MASSEDFRVYTRELSRLHEQTRRVLPAVDGVRLDEIVRHRVKSVVGEGADVLPVIFQHDASPRVHESILRRTMHAHNFGYSLTCYRQYLEWLHGRGVRAQNSAPDNWSRLEALAALCDAHDTHGCELRPGDIVDSSVLFAPLGVHRFAHTFVYLGGGFVAHIHIDRACVKWGLRNPVHQALSLSSTGFMTCLFTVARKWDVNVHGLMFSRTHAAAHGLVAGGCTRTACRERAVNRYPDTAKERWGRVATALMSTGMYGYNLVHQNCQHFVSSVCGGPFESYAAQDILSGFAAILAAAALVLLGFVVFFIRRGGGRRRSA